MGRLPPPLAGALAFGRAVLAGWGRHDGERMAAAMAFYALFSIAPALLVTTSLMGFWMGEVAAKGQLAAQLLQWMGPEMAATVLGLVQRAHQPKAELTAAGLGLLTLAWSATRGFAQLQAALDDIFEVEAVGKALVGALRQRALAFVLVLGMGLLMGVSALVNASISALSRWTEGVLPMPGWVAYGIGDLSSFLTLSLGYLGVYQLLPQRRAALSDALTGACAAAALFTAGRHGLGLYLSKADPGSAYGASGSLVVLLLWLYYSALSLLLGAEVVATRARLRRAAEAGPTGPAPGGDAPPASPQAPAAPPAP